MLTKFGKPALHILEGGAGCNVVHHQRTNSTAVVAIIEKKIHYTYALVMERYLSWPAIK